MGGRDLPGVALIRQVWIDGVLSRDGLIRPASIADAFRVTPQRAALDLQHYRAEHPRLVRKHPRGFYLRRGTGSAYPQDIRAAVLRSQAQLIPLYHKR